MRLTTSVANVDVVSVVAEREGRPTETEQRDDLLRLQLGREQQGRPHGLLGRPARLLVAGDDVPPIAAMSTACP